MMAGKLSKPSALKGVVVKIALLISSIVNGSIGNYGACRVHSVSWDTDNGRGGGKKF